MLRKIHPRFAPPRAYLSGLGMTGYTAYFGLLDIGLLLQRKRLWCRQRRRRRAHQARLPASGMSRHWHCG